MNVGHWAECPGEHCTGCGGSGIDDTGEYDRVCHCRYHEPPVFA